VHYCLQIVILPMVNSHQSISYIELKIVDANILIEHSFLAAMTDVRSHSTICVENFIYQSRQEEYKKQASSVRKNNLSNHNSNSKQDSSSNSDSKGPAKKKLRFFEHDWKTTPEKRPRSVVDCEYNLNVINFMANFDNGNNYLIMSNDQRTLK